MLKGFSLIPFGLSLNLPPTDIHRWDSRTISSDQSDYIVIDLDPKIPIPKMRKKEKRRGRRVL
jgi:DNA primase